MVECCYQAYVSQKRDYRTGKPCGVIWSLPPELIGKRVIIIPEDCWSIFKEFLEMIEKIMEDYEKKGSVKLMHAIVRRLLGQT